MTGPAVSGSGLVLPREPADETRALGRAYAAYLTGCCHRFLALADALPPAWRPVHAQIATLLRNTLQRGNRTALRCFASSAVSTPMQCLALRRELPDFAARIEAAAAGILPNLLLEMALRGVIPGGVSVLWAHGAPPLASIALGGELTAPPAATGWRFSSSHVAAIAGGEELARVPTDPEALHRMLASATPGLAFRRCFRPLGTVAHFATIDHNPIAAFEAHPDKSGNHVDLGGRSEAEWIRTLEESFALIERFLPGELAEMRVMLHEVIPVGYDAVRHLSASYREAVGTIYVTLHPNVMTMTEALIHEFQHNKFNVSAYAAEYLRNAFHPRYKSPVRPDPRPLWGIMLAVHAFLPVAELYRRMRDAGHPSAARPDFERRMNELDLKNHEGMEMLRAHAELTPAGDALFADLEALERRHLAERTARGLPTTPTDIHVE